MDIEIYKTIADDILNRVDGSRNMVKFWSRTLQYGIPDPVEMPDHQVYLTNHMLRIRVQKDVAPQVRQFVRSVTVDLYKHWVSHNQLKDLKVLIVPAHMSRQSTVHISTNDKHIELQRQGKSYKFSIVFTVENDDKQHTSEIESTTYYLYPTADQNDVDGAQGWLNTESELYFSEQEMQRVERANRARRQQKNTIHKQAQDEATIIMSNLLSEFQLGDNDLDEAMTQFEKLYIAQNRLELISMADFTKEARLMVSTIAAAKDKRLRQQKINIREKAVNECLDKYNSPNLAANFCENDQDDSLDCRNFREDRATAVTELQKEVAAAPNMNRRDVNKLCDALKPRRRTTPRRPIGQAAKVETVAEPVAEIKWLPVEAEAVITFEDLMNRYEAWLGSGALSAEGHSIVKLSKRDRFNLRLKWSTILVSRDLDLANMSREDQWETAKYVIGRYLESINGTPVVSTAAGESLGGIGFEFTEPDPLQPDPMQTVVVGGAVEEIDSDDDDDSNVNASDVPSRTFVDQRPKSNRTMSLPAMPVTQRSGSLVDTPLSRSLDIVLSDNTIPFTGPVQITRVPAAAMSPPGSSFRSAISNDLAAKLSVQSLEESFVSVTSPVMVMTTVSVDDDNIPDMVPSVNEDGSVDLVWINSNSDHNGSTSSHSGFSDRNNSVADLASSLASSLGGEGEAMSPVEATEALASGWLPWALRMSAQATVNATKFGINTGAQATKFGIKTGARATVGVTKFGVKAGAQVVKTGANATWWTVKEGVKTAWRIPKGLYNLSVYTAKDSGSKADLPPNLQDNVIETRQEPSQARVPNSNHISEFSPNIMQDDIDIQPESGDFTLSNIEESANLFCQRFTTKETCPPPLCSTNMFGKPCTIFASKGSALRSKRTTMANGLDKLANRLSQLGQEGSIVISDYQQGQAPLGKDFERQKEWYLTMSNKRWGLPRNYLYTLMLRDWINSGGRTKPPVLAYLIVTKQVHQLLSLVKNPLT